MTDVPTQWTPYNVTGDVGGVIRGNYATLNPVYKAYSQPTLTNGNLTVTSNSGAYQNTMGTMGLSSGKFYWETQVVGTNSSADYLGVSSLSEANYLITNSNVIGSTASGYSCNINSGEKYNNGSGSSYGSALANGDILMCALDLDNGGIYWGKNGTWFNSGNPATQTNPAFTGLSGTYLPAFGTYTHPVLGAMVYNCNFGQYAFSYAPPSGYKSLCTTNLPTPTIQQGNLYMNATTYTGNGTGAGSTQTISNGNFQPDLIWMKSRSTADYHDLVDSVRGIVGTGSPNLFSNTTGAEATFTGYGVSAVTSTGFTLIGNGSYTNTNGVPYVGWQWQAGQGTNTTNTAGSITSTVSVNPTAGFSVVTYTGTGSSGTVGHGLGVAPAMMIVKSRNATQYWIVQHQSLPAITYNMYLQLTDPQQNDAQFTAKSSTTVTVNGGSVTGSGINYVMYCWAEVAGFSKFGSYTGNGSTDGPFVYCGFRPKFVLMKATTGSNNWIIYDTVRNTYNLTNLSLCPDSRAAENGVSGTTENTLDILSNGFKLRTSNALTNGSSVPYIYMAFAEYPFKSALAR